MELFKQMYTVLVIGLILLVGMSQASDYVSCCNLNYNSIILL